MTQIYHPSFFFLLLFKKKFYYKDYTCGYEPIWFLYNTIYFEFKSKTFYESFASNANVLDIHYIILCILKKNSP